MLTWRTLGPLRVSHGHRDVTPTAPKVRQVLAVLLARRNSVVPLSALTAELWPGHPPRSATATVQTYAYQLRKALHGGEDPGDTGPLVTRAHGYLLRVEPGSATRRSSPGSPAGHGRRWPTTTRPAPSLSSTGPSCCGTARRSRTSPTAPRCTGTPSGWRNSTSRPRNCASLRASASVGTANSSVN